ncbi:MAG: DUF86 domain-containing protein [Candidatus Kerfeldbacteria bacterium]|nr:DUF86 domain-containing protein [Candidatus Kerfeldbacteria bacterium]
MSEHTAELYLEDIKTAVEKIQTYTYGLSYDDFIGDDKTTDAIIRNVEIMGEAAFMGDTTRRFAQIKTRTR